MQEDLDWRIPKGNSSTGTDVSERGFLVPSNRIGDMDRYRYLMEELRSGTWGTPHALVCDVYWHIQNLPLHCWALSPVGRRGPGPCSVERGQGGGGDQPWSNPPHC